MPGNIVTEIYDEIRKRNEAVNAKCIPDSDEFINYVSAFHGLQSAMTKQILRVLTEAHKIFSIEIVVEDSSRNVPRIEGYVAADIQLIRKMKAFFQNELVYMYNTQFSKNLMYRQILKELFPRIKSYNNTAMGQVINKAVMLEEYEKLMERNFREYTDAWKENLLRIELGKANLLGLSDPQQKEQSTVSPSRPFTIKKEKPAREVKSEHAKRAVDQPRYKEFISKTREYPLQKILSIYGIKFFLQVYLRQCKFGYIQKLIEDKQITRRSELMLLRDMLRTVKQNIYNDPNSKKHLENIYSLERTISHFIYFSDVSG